MGPVGEVEYIETIASESATGSHGPTKAAAAIIGYADLKLGEQVRPVLEAMREASPNRFRGSAARNRLGRKPRAGQPGYSGSFVHRRLSGRG